MTVDEMAEVELAYVQPFSSAKDPALRCRTEDAAIIDRAGVSLAGRSSLARQLGHEQRVPASLSSMYVYSKDSKSFEQDWRPSRPCAINTACFPRFAHALGQECAGG
jgi:hypothetical protein